ncbi:hypothetical protein T11_9322 [Trichinella zimbabwensis]|uniref:Retrovirus-related Pol polyprotein from transposon n=1 Tax=Trichinella zimbabwensis TaxID=268475 RepID=A0A0V1HRF3_9BILA|nr:hypothetical protein T11_9322 [Trichinella zimbabwensis]
MVNVSLCAYKVSDEFRIARLPRPGIAGLPDQIHCTTSATPSRVVFSKELRLPVDLMYGLPTDAPERSAGMDVQHLRGDLERLYETEQRRLKVSRDRKVYGPVYEPGDQVCMQLLTKTKLGAYWDGPYQVQKKMDWNTYQVEKMGSGRERLVVQFDQLMPYHGTRHGEASAFGPDDRWQSTEGRRHVAVIGCVRFWFQISHAVIYCGGCHMSSSNRVGGRKVNSDSDDPAENNKVVADPPAVTENPLQYLKKPNKTQHF